MLLVKSADDGMHMSAAPEEPNERLASFDLWAEGIRRTNAMMCGAARARSLPRAKYRAREASRAIGL